MQETSIFDFDIFLVSVVWDEYFYGVIGTFFIKYKFYCRLIKIIKKCDFSFLNERSSESPNKTENSPTKATSK